VPIAPFKAGDFSTLTPRTLVIMTPRSNPRTPLPNNIMRRQRSTAPRRTCRAVSGANLAGQINNYLYNPVQTKRVNQFNIRTDYRTSASAIFARFSWEDPDTFNPGNLPEPAVGAGPGRPGRVVFRGKQAVIAMAARLGRPCITSLRRLLPHSRASTIRQRHPTLAEDLAFQRERTRRRGRLGAHDHYRITGLGDGSGVCRRSTICGKSTSP